MNLCRTAGRMTALVLAALVLVGLPAMALPAFAAGKLATPAGPVILTVHGRIANTNRGALVAFDDAFFKSSGAEFDRAAVFDRAMLQKLGMHSVTVQYRSEEHTSELQSLMRLSYAVFCLKKQKKHKT